MRRPWIGMASFVAVLLVLALEHRGTPWFVERLGIDCDRLLRERLWKLYGEGQFGRLRGAALLNI